MTDTSTNHDQWVIVEPGVIVLPTTGYEIRREAGKYQAYHQGVKIDGSWTLLSLAKSVTVRSHMRDLMDVGLEP